MTSTSKLSIMVTLPKPMTSGAKSEGRFGKQDFRYVAEEDVSRPRCNSAFAERTAPFLLKSLQVIGTERCRCLTSDNFPLSRPTSAPNSASP
jgi:hypothetical protein